MSFRTKTTTFLEDLQFHLSKYTPLGGDKVQGHVKNEIGVWFSGATLRRSIG